MRKGRDGEWWWWKKNNGENSGPLTSMPVDRLTATDCNADRSCQYKVNFANTERLKKIQYYIHAKPTQ